MLCLGLLRLRPETNTATQSRERSEQVTCTPITTQHNTHFEEDVGAHGFAVRDDRLLVFALAVPAVELDAATAGQQRLSVHLDRGLAAELAPAQVRVVRGVDVVMRQWLVHVLVDLESVEEDGRVLVRHQVATETIEAEHAWRNKTKLYCIESLQEASCYACKRNL